MASLPVKAAKRGKARGSWVWQDGEMERWRDAVCLPEAVCCRNPAPIWGFSKRQLNVRHRVIEPWGAPLVGRALISDPAGRVALAQRLWRQKIPNKSRLLFILISFVSVDPEKHDLEQRCWLKINVQRGRNNVRDGRLLMAAAVDLVSHV